MTREELKAILPEATEEQITAFLNKHHEELNKNKTDEAVFKESIAAAKKAQKEAEKALKDLQDSQLSDADKMQKAIDEAEASKAEYMTKLNRLDIEKMFVEAGIASEQYDPILDSIVTSDIDSSKKTAESFVGLLKSQKEAVEKSVREQLSAGTPDPHGAAGGSGDADPKLTAAEQLAQSLAKGNSTNVKSAKDALSYYTGGTGNGNEND